MKIKLNDLRPGMTVWPEWDPPLELKFSNVVEQVAFGNGPKEPTSVSWVSPYGGTDVGQPDDEVEVPAPAPKVLMSWDADSQTWAILISTEDAPTSHINIALNDAELFDGITDPEV